MLVQHFTKYLACLAIGLAIPSDSRGGDLKFAAMLKQRRPAWPVNSINIEY